MPSLPAHPCSEPGCGGLTFGRYCQAHQAQRTRARPDLRPSAARRGYGQQHRKLRAAVLRRDPVCRNCGQAPSTVADHVLPLAQGGADTLENLQGLCRGCHNGKTRREATGRQGKFAMPVTVVCGPPGSGKSTYVRERLTWGDLVIDLDTIFAAISGQDMYDKPEVLLPLALATKRFLLAQLEVPSDLQHAWVITGGARKEERERYRQQGAEIILLTTKPAECLRRIAADARRSGRASLWIEAIRRWFVESRREG